MRERLAIIGSGNWGSTIAMIAGERVLEWSQVPERHMEREVRMWVFEETVDGQKLTDLINTRHENVKYLPGIPLPHNVTACPDLVETVKDATLLVFVLPHQFVKKVCEQLRGHIAPSARAISLIKGLDGSQSGIQLVSHSIRDALQIDVSVLMGANIANEVAARQFCETTVGYADEANGALWRELFHTDYFHTHMVQDVAGVELCGALKNIIAVAAGFVDGLKGGDNTKAAIIRIGLIEMRRFASMYYKGVNDQTFLESCGVADVITTCFGGRNRRVAEAFVLSDKSFAELEDEMLNGQKLQGVLTAAEVCKVLERDNKLDQFPLFHRVHLIAEGNADPKTITQIKYVRGS
ncbi:hypothetical protein CXG81DRAFT_27639 [Caulochytrium protostelioides]|uniref:Glycerol-3-phosphate dehydrogenase [NAD(+)] n=1 Tax=Caulochytrium protostelioides TaxID=1555241 RepID=A0A4P9X029_9FUNG|nr:NAD-dependent glycerol-3-phosphate dehydrogenase [Caulochytrium protostelioides]RKO99613.1 hypothetical protein CXG81DRAFT_27639 [Caulochytrium protostelioides]|eukprot:RKO99613.1 hypothetical protein CXG81DRAFT_27639 [Caulochytrium protostelioides]